MLRIDNTDALSFLRSLPNNYVDCVTCSPPYLAQRRYNADGYLWEEVRYCPMPGMPEIVIPEWRGELGLEPTVEAYIGHLILIFREVKRVLKPTGNFWLNIGDKHGRGTRVLWEGDSKRGDKKRKKMFDHDGYAQSPAVMKEKSLALTPQRIALAMDADGWYVRMDVILAKANSMPESVQDRFCSSHEYFWHFTKRTDYWFDMQAVAEPVADSTIPRSQRGISEVHKMVDGAPGQSRHSMMKPRQNAKNALKQDGVGNPTYPGFNERWNTKMSGGDFSKKYAGAQLEHGGESHRKPYLTRSRRSVMSVTTHGSAYDYCRCGKLYLGSERSKIRGERVNEETGKVEKIMLPCLQCGKDNDYVAHFAAFYRNWIEPVILSSCPPICCAECGTPYERIVKRVAIQTENEDGANDDSNNKEPYQQNNPHRTRLYKNEEGEAYVDYGGRRKRADAPGAEITSKTSMFNTGKVALKESVYFPPTDRPQRKRAEELFMQHGLTQEHLDAISAVGIADTGKALVTTNGAGKNDPEVQRLAAEAKEALGGYYREFLTGKRETLGWQKMCKCETGDTVPGIVCDMFSGSGTSAMTALANQRDFVGCELNSDYHALSLARIDRWREDPQFREDQNGITPEELERGNVVGHSKPVMINLFGVD